MFSDFFYLFQMCSFLKVPYCILYYIKYIILYIQSNPAYNRCSSDQRKNSSYPRVRCEKIIMIMTTEIDKILRKAENSRKKCDIESNRLTQAEYSEFPPRLRFIIFSDRKHLLNSFILINLNISS